MEYALLGWPPDGPTLRLDHRRFAYAGKFVVSNTGKAVARGAAAPDAVDAADAGTPDEAPDGVSYDTDVAAAVAFSADRTDGSLLRLRYLTVRSDLKRQAIGPRLATVVAAAADRRAYDRVAIAVNNPFAYEAMYKAGFAWTGRESGLAELLLERPAGDLGDSAAPSDPGTYRDGLDRYRRRDLGDPEASFLDDRVGADPPARVDPPEWVDAADPEA